MQALLGEHVAPALRCFAAVVAMAAHVTGKARLPMAPIAAKAVGFIALAGLLDARTGRTESILGDTVTIVAG